MERFRDDGHLTNEALTALVQGAALAEDARLEIAEHLAYCDVCLQRYTDLLAGEVLLVPQQSCQETLWVRVRRRTLRLVTSRYATAAAAVALALTMVWSGIGPSFQTRPDRFLLLQQAGAAMNQWAASWPQAMEDTFSGLTGFFDDFGGRFQAAPQGGN